MQMQKKTQQFVWKSHQIMLRPITEEVWLRKKWGN